MQHHIANNPYVLEFSPPLTGDGLFLQPLKVAVKDLFHMAGYPTTAGNPDWLKTHTIPTSTSPVISTLLNNGACIVGKTITDELAYSLNGQNIHYGTPINGNNPDLLPGGSSSGSAVAVAEGIADIGLGTDTGGSIRVPASYNGLYGLRPSHGVISTQHMVALAPSFDTVGWMTKDLSTLTKVAEVLLSDLPPAAPDKHNGLAYSEEINAACAQHFALKDVLSSLQQKTHLDLLEFSSVLGLNYLQLAADAFRTLQGAEIWLTHGQWIDEHQPVFAPDIAARFAWCRNISTEQQQQALAVQEAFKQQITRIFTQVDYILLPTTPGSAPLLNSTDSDLANYRNTLLSMTCIAGLAGLPQLQLPLKQTSTGPMGISLIAPKYHDRQLLEFAKNLLDLL